MKIVVPTYMREDRQRAWEMMPKFIRDRTTLVTHSGREEILRDNYPDADVHNLGKTDGIADVRQKILEWVSSSHDKMFMLDDGCIFYTSERQGDRRKIAPRNFRGLGGLSHWKDMLDTLDRLTDEYFQVGISPRPGNNRFLDSLMSPGRVYSCFALNLELVESIGARFDGMYQKDPEIRLYEDFYFTLHALTRGHPNALVYDYGFMHDHGKAGGNSTIRNQSLQKKCIEALQKEFPDYVKLVQREAKSWNVGDEKFRWECVIYWKKALTQAINKGA